MNNSLRHISRVVVVPLMLMMQGCPGPWMTPDISITGWPEDFVQKETLPTLVGKHEEEILQALGPPTFFVQGVDSVSYVYQKYEDDTYVKMFLWFPFYVGEAEDEKVSCVLLKFDEGRILRGYELEMADAVDFKKLRDHDKVTYYSKKEPISCKTLFGINKHEVLEVDKCVFEKIRHNLEINAWYKEYYHQTFFDSTDPARFKYLCWAANHGHPNAQADVARHILQGVGDIQKDYKHAYVWFSLANQSCDYSVQLQHTMQQMTEQEIADAEKILSNWSPSLCESVFQLKNPSR